MSYQEPRNVTAAGKCLLYNKDVVVCRGLLFIRPFRTAKVKYLCIIVGLLFMFVFKAFHL